MSPDRRYLRVPRNAEFPTLPLPESFTEYSLAYYDAVESLWGTVSKSGGVPVPDNLVYPILFLVHHYLELELKDAIGFTYSIRSMEGENTPDHPEFVHSISRLLAELDESLPRVPGMQGNQPLSPDTRDLIRDMDEFGIMGQALRYPYYALGYALQRNAREELPYDGLIPNVQGVMDLLKQASNEFEGFVSLLIETEQAYWDSRSY